MSGKQWPKDRTETLQFDELVPPAVAVIRQGYVLTRQKAKLSYNGYTLPVPSIPGYARGQDPEEAITKESLAYHAERGRDLLDVVAGIVFNLGVEQGQRMVAEAYQEKLRQLLRAAKRIGRIEGMEAALDAMDDPVRSFPPLMEDLQADKRCADIEAKWLARVVAEIEVK